MARWWVFLLGLIGAALMIASHFLPIAEYSGGDATKVGDRTSLVPLIAAGALVTLIVRPAFAWIPTACWLLVYLSFAFLEEAMSWSGYEQHPPWGWGAAIGGAGCVIVASVRWRKRAAALERRARPQTDVSAFE
jgi:hypothetical protein